MSCFDNLKFPIILIHRYYSKLSTVILIYDISKEIAKKRLSLIANQRLFN